MSDPGSVHKASLGSPVLELQGVTLRRDGTQILREIDWTVVRGEHWAVLGPNGSGKTTLLQVVTGYEWPSQGLCACWAPSTATSTCASCAGPLAG